MKDNDTTAIILGGGKGSRTGLKTPKQYIEVCGKKIIEYSLEILEKTVQKTIVVVPDVDHWNSLGIQTSATIVKGGNERNDSLANGLRLVNTKKVIIHDASRPLVEPAMVNKIIDSLDVHPCAYPILPVKSTIVVDDNNTLLETLRRDALHEVQTPQGFLTEDLKDIMEDRKLLHHHLPEAMRRKGKRVKHISGSPWLFKITYEPDVYSLEVFLKQKRIQ